MSIKSEEPVASIEGVKFEDLDLVYVFSFDLGAPVKAKDLGEWFSRSKLVEGIWIPPSEYRPTPEFVRRKARELGIKDAEKISVEELMKNEKLMKEINKTHATFLAIISEDREACIPAYLELSRYVRLKLIDLNVRIEDPKFSYLNKELACELYLLLHDAGIGIITVWIHLNGDLSTDNVIEIEKKLLKAKCIIKDPFGSTFTAKSLDKFIDQSVITPLQVAVAFSSEHRGFDEAIDAWSRGYITPDELEKKLRVSYTVTHVVVCIRKYSCRDECTTAEDAVKRHPREIFGILAQYENWRYARMDFVINEYLRGILSISVDHSISISTGISLLIGSIMLDERLKSVEAQELAYQEMERDAFLMYRPTLPLVGDYELAYRGIELLVVLPTEFLQLSDMILNVYTSVYRNEFGELRKRRRRGEPVRPSEIMKIREELMDGLEEYNNVSVFAAVPYRKIMEYGKERLMLSDKVNMLLSGLQELSDIARTCYEEEVLRNQESLSRIQVELGARQVELAVRQEDLSKMQVILTIFSDYSEYSR
jgi:hypothetical protein